MLVAVAAMGSVPAVPSSRPVIGIYPTVGRGSGYYKAYSLWLEQAGADSFVTRAFMDDKELEATFQSMNGFLIPGGGDPFGETVDRLVSRAVAANLANDFFPVWGTCLGFEWLVDHFAKNRSAIGPGFDSEDLPLPLSFKSEAASSRTYSHTNSTMLRWLSSEPITYNAHRKGIEPAAFSSTPALAQEFNVLATGADRNGRGFIAQIEHKTLPVYASRAVRSHSRPRTLTIILTAVASPALSTQVRQPVPSRED